MINGDIVNPLTIRPSRPRNSSSIQKENTQKACGYWDGAIGINEVRNYQRSDILTPSPDDPD